MRDYIHKAAFYKELCLPYKGTVPLRVAGVPENNPGKEEIGRFPAAPSSH